MGYNVFQSDADTVYIRDALRTMDNAINKHAADGVFLQESPLNTGNWYVRNTPEVQRVFTEWLKGVPAVNLTYHDQDRLGTLKDKIYKVCADYWSCTTARREGLAAFFAHTRQMLKGICPYSPWDEDPCHERRLYVHAICKSGVLNKTNCLAKLNLWFLDEDGALKSKKQISEQAPFLPCKAQIAWVPGSQPPNV